MHKFWTVRPRIVTPEGKNTIAIPALPPGAVYSTTHPGDLIVAGQNTSGHVHTVIGGNIGAPNPDYPQHYHWFIRRRDDTVATITIGDEHHPHDLDVSPKGFLLPKYYLLLVTANNPAFDALHSAGWIVFAERSYDEANDNYAPTSTTTWSTARREAIEDRINLFLGLALPAPIDNDKELLTWLLDLGSHRHENEERHN